MKVFTTKGERKGYSSQEHSNENDGDQVARYYLAKIT